MYQAGARLLSDSRKKTAPEFTLSAVEKPSARSRQKRPDLQVYVPRKQNNVACPEPADGKVQDACSAIPSKCETSAARKPANAFGEHHNAPTSASGESKRFSERRRQRDVHVSAAMSHGGGEKLRVHLLENCSDNNTDSSLEWDYETDIHLAKLKYVDDGFDAGDAPLKDAGNAPLKDAGNAPLKDAGNAPLKDAGNAPFKDAGDAPLKDLKFDDDDNGLESDVVKTGKRRRRRRRKPTGHEDGDTPAVAATQSWADIMENEERRDTAPGRHRETELNRNQSSNKTSSSTSVEAAIADAIFNGLVIENSGKGRERRTSGDFVQGGGDDRDVTDDGRQGGNMGGGRRSGSLGGGGRRRNKSDGGDECVRMKQNDSKGGRLPDATLSSRDQHSDRAGAHVNQNVHVTTAVVRDRRNSDDYARSTEPNAMPRKIRDGLNLNAPLKVVCSSREAGRLVVHARPGSLATKPRDTAPKEQMEMNPTLGDRGVVDVRGVITTSHLATSPLYPSYPGASRGGRGNVRGGSHRSLFDPNNPTKPVQVSSPKNLQFEDPFESQYSPDSSCFYDGYTPTGAPNQGPYNAGYPVHSMGSVPGNDGPGYACPPQAYVDDSYNNEHFSHRFVQHLSGSLNPLQSVSMVFYG